MVGTMQPLQRVYAIVDAAGLPTDYFIRWAQARQEDIAAAVDEETVQQLATQAVEDWAASRSVTAGAGLAGGGTLAQDIELELDAGLNDLNDVDTVTAPPTDGQALLWDNTAGLWVPGAVSVANSLDDLTDVDISTTPPTDGQALVWDNTAGLWVPGTASGGGGGSPTIAMPWVIATQASTSAYNAKGILLTPVVAYTLLGIVGKMQFVSGTSYKAYLVTMSGSTVSSVLASSSTITASSSDTLYPTKYFPFSAPVTLTAGTEYGLVIGTTSGSTTYALPVIGGSGTYAADDFGIEGNLFNIGDGVRFNTLSVASGSSSSTSSISSSLPLLVGAYGYAGTSGSGGGGLTRISQVITSGSQASVTFSSIPATYEDLLIVVAGRADKAATYDDFRVRLNGDTAANYDSEGTESNNTSAVGVANLAATWFNAGWLPAASAPSGVAGSCEITLPNYARTTFHKTIHGKSALKLSSAASGFYVRHFGGWWRSTSAITSVTLFPLASNFVDNSVVTLYGRT